ncbi:MAG TPA: hypothetical protein VH740_10640 [Vicinamibacterales bacterium]
MNDRGSQLTTAEIVVASWIGACAAAIAVPYAVARLGGPIHPRVILLLSIAAAFSVAVRLRRGRAKEDARDLLPFAAILGGVLAALLWLGWPALLPLGGGSDLTHHLQLVDFIERHWRLPQGPDAERLIGGMVSYTPGVHLISAMAGRWIGRDGLHAMYSVLSVSAAMKAALVFLIARRLLPDDRLQLPSAAAAALILFLPFDYFAGSFVRASFLAQAFAEMFAVAMWWALVVWERSPSTHAAAIFAIAGIGVFLTWPVWIGPPVLAFVGALALRRETAWMRHAALALVPIAAVAIAHTLGRASSAAIVQTGGSTFWPEVSRFSWPFLLLAAIGGAIAFGERRLRVTWVLLGAIALQAIVLYVLATRSGSDTPYMALKMVHFAVYPMAVLAALSIGAAFRWLMHAGSRTRVAGPVPVDASVAACWAVVFVLVAAIVRLAAAGPPQVPVITEDLFRAGAWARAHVPTACVEYLVPQDASAYWLHHAVLGNPSYPPPGARMPAFSFRDAVVRWITRTSVPFAIADVHAIPREVREEIDERARFGQVIVGVRRGAQPACD